MSTKLHAKSYNNKRLFLTVNPNEDIAENDPVRVVDAIVEGLDLREFKKLYHEKGRFRTDEIQYGIPTLPTLRQRQGHNGLCLLRHSLQHKENVLKDSKTDSKWGKRKPKWPVFASLRNFTA